MNERLIRILLESFPKILLPGLTMTIPLTVISFSLALVIAVVTAIVQFANVKVLKQIARFYIWVVRGTPLLHTQSIKCLVDIFDFQHRHIYTAP